LRGRSYVQTAAKIYRRMKMVRSVPNKPAPDYMQRKLNHYNEWLLNPKRAVGTGPYPGFPEDLALERGHKITLAIHQEKIAKKKAAASKPKALRARSAPGQPTKLDRAKALRVSNPGASKDTLISMFIDQLGMSKAGATTYYYSSAK
jgi:hypothetical protein